MGTRWICQARIDGETAKGLTKKLSLNDTETQY